MSWLIFTLSPIIGVAVAYFDPALGVQVGAVGMCAGVGVSAVSTVAVNRQVQTVPVRVGGPSRLRAAGPAAASR